MKLPSILLSFLLIINMLLAVPDVIRAEDEYRLPKLYAPSAYKIELTLPPGAFTVNSNDFIGKVAVNISFTNSTNYISLHVQQDYITVTKITLNDSEISTFTLNNVTDILKIELENMVSTGVTYALVIEYTGVLSTIDMYGLYKSSYVDGSNSTKYLVTNMFAATYARRAFPCFDEPSLKATFDFSITIPTGLNAIFNTPQKSTSSNGISGLTTVTFDTTPKMSTYLIAFIVSEFTCTSGQPIGLVPYQVCSRNESASTRDLAVEYGPKLLASLNNFTGYDYNNSMGKMDQVAIPDFAAGAMENWGLITYRETRLLWDKDESSNINKQTVVTVIAHELAHQWFGNLVTLKWWSEIFLNEGFASYLELYISHEILPSWQLDKQFVLEKVHSAFQSDALVSAHALESSCATPAEISLRFSTISYRKGASVLKMVESFMHKDNFKAGLQDYIATFAYRNADPEDLWIVLNKSVVDSVSHLPANLSTVMENWTKKSGFPLLTVSLEGREVTVSQNRYLFSGEDDSTKWYVPLSYTTSLDSNKFQTTTPKAWLLPTEDLKISLPETCDWIIINNQHSGYYRVNYDPTLWEKIKSALNNDDFDGIAELNRAQIVNDLFNLARIKEIKYSEAFIILTFLANETSYYSWQPAFSGYSFLLGRVGENSNLGIAISAQILGLMRKLYASVPIATLREDDQIYTLNQVLTLTWACKLGNEDCVEKVQQLFSQYRSSGQRPNKNLRSIVYCNALRYSNDSSDWYFLWNVYTTSANLATEQNTILSALGCTREKNLLAEYLNKTVTDGSGIRSHDALTAFSSVYSENSEGVDVAFEFLIENQQVFENKYQSMNSLGSLIKGIAGRFTTQSQISRLREFVEEGNLAEDFKLSANEALESAEQNLKWLEDFKEDLRDYYGIGGTGVLTALSLPVIVSVICLILTM